MRRSLALRLAGTMAVAGLIILAIIAVFVSSHIRNGIFADRLQAMLDDAAIRTNSIQQRFDITAASTAEQVQALAHEVLTSTQDTAAGAGAVGVSLLRSQNNKSAVQIVDMTSPDMAQVITPEMRQAVRESGGQHWQSVSLTTAEGGNAPGVVVGSPVNVPLAGIYEFYVVYSLESEQSIIALVMGVLLAGSIALLILLAGMTWAIIYRVLIPLRSTVRTAERITNGDLDARVKVTGEDEMAALGNSFNKMAESIQSQIAQLDELSQLQQRFVSDVSHELRTPLTTMRIADDVIYDAREELDPAAARSAELLHDQIERLDSMLADLLEISRIDSGGAILNPEVHDLCELVEKTVVNNQALAAKVGCEVNLHLPGHPCTAEVDDRRIERIVRNLLVNAIEHSEGNPIDVTVDSSDTGVAVRVRDHGVGMSPEVTARVFDRFYRADPARARTTGGTGLGLAISLEDARLSGGNLQAWGRLGEGSSFLLVLPRQVGVPVGTSPLPLTDAPAPGAEPPAVTASIPVSPGLLGATALPPGQALPHPDDVASPTSLAGGLETRLNSAQREAQDEE